jgi:hypothetical protein
LGSVAGIVECSEGLVENPNRLQLALMLSRRFTEVVKNIQVMYKEAGNNSSMLVIFMVCPHEE